MNSEISYLATRISNLPYGEPTYLGGLYSALPITATCIKTSWGVTSMWKIGSRCYRNATELATDLYNGDY